MGNDARRANQRAELKGLLLALLGSLCFSQNFVSGRYAMEAYNPETFCSLWFLAGAAYAFVYLVATRRPLFSPAIRRSWKELLGIGLVYAVGSLLGFTAISLIDPTVAAFANRTQTPFMILLGVLFLRERPRVRDWIGIVLCLAGLFVTSYASGAALTRGVLLMVAHAFCYSLATLLAKRITREVPSAVIAMYRSLFTGLGNLAFSLPTGRFVARVYPANLAALLVGAFFGPFLGHVALFRGLKQIDLAKASVCLAMQPVFVALLAWPLLNMLPTPRQLFGGGIIMAGVLLLVMPRHNGGRGAGAATNHGRSGAKADTTARGYEVTQ